MFEIPDDDMFWDDDFLLDDRDFEKEQAAEMTDCSKSKGTAELINTEKSNSTESTVESKSLCSENCLRSAQSGVGENTSYNHNTNSAADDTVLKKGIRKFPGPAGILPPSTPTVLHPRGPDGKSNTHLLEESHGSALVKDEICSLSLSQAPTEDVFMSPLWKTVLNDIGPDAQTVLNKFSIKSMLLKASRKMLIRGKIPLIIGVIESLELQGADASFVIRDISGKMNGSLHRDLVKDPVSAIQAGSVLILRQVSVISPSSRTHYLNVTPGNVVLVYTASKDTGVCKRSWSPPLSALADPADEPSLKQILEISEQELSASLRMFRHNLHKGVLSDALPKFSSPALSSRANRGVRQPSPFRFRSPGSKASFRPSTQSAPTLFNSTAQGHIRTPQPRNLAGMAHTTNCGQQFSGRPTMSPAAFSGTTVKFQQPNASKISNTTSGSASTFGICGARAVRNSSVISAGSVTSPLYNSPSAAIPVSSHGANGAAKTVNNTTFNSTNTTSNHLGIDTGFGDDFPDDDDDHMILKLCDEALSPLEACSSLVNMDFEKYQSSSKSNCDSAVGKELGDGGVDRTSLKENHTHGKVPEMGTPIKNAVYIGNTSNENHGIPPVCSSISVLKQRPNKFIFKRANSSLDSPHSVLPVKRPMCERQASTSVWRKNTNSEIDAETCLLSDHMQNNENTVSDTKSGNCNVMPHQANLTTPQTGQKVYEKQKSTYHLSENRQNNSAKIAPSRDADIEVEKFKSLPPGENLDVQSVSDIPRWDDDLNDDFLLSQLSDDF